MSWSQPGQAPLRCRWPAAGGRGGDRLLTEGAGGCAWEGGGRGGKAGVPGACSHPQIDCSQQAEGAASSPGAQGERQYWSSRQAGLVGSSQRQQSRHPGRSHCGEVVGRGRGRGRALQGRHVHADRTSAAARAAGRAGAAFFFVLFLCASALAITLTLLHQVLPGSTLMRNQPSPQGFCGFSAERRSMVLQLAGGKEVLGKRREGGRGWLGRRPRQGAGRAWLHQARARRGGGRGPAMRLHLPPPPLRPAPPHRGPCSAWSSTRAAWCPRAWACRARGSRTPESPWPPPARRRPPGARTPAAPPPHPASWTLPPRLGRRPGPPLAARMRRWRC